MAMQKQLEELGIILQNARAADSALYVPEGS
jgi:hypothetical protein